MADAVQLNEQAGTLFHKGCYQDAAETYEAAIVADNRQSPVYYSNVAAAYLKLQRFDLARDAAHSALLLDCKSIKARYRRAMARRALGLLPHCLVDLTSVLTTDPLNREAKTAFAETMRLFETAGKRTFPVNQIPSIDYPAAHGSPSAAPQNHTFSPSPSRQQAEVDPPNPRKVTCERCHDKHLPRDEATYCETCGVSPYCNPACRRADRRVHQVRCDVLAKNKALLGLTERFGLPDPYFRPLIESYAIRALGLHVGTPFASPMVLIFHFGLVSLKSGVYANRLSIEHISLIPIAILQRDTEKLCHLFLAAAPSVRGPDAHLVSIMYNPRIDADLGPTIPSDCFTALNVLSLTQEKLRSSKSPTFKLSLCSLSLGMTRDFSTELDVLYRGMEDEIALDVHNYHGFRARS